MRNKIVFEIFIFYYQRYKGRQPWGPWHTQDMVYLTPSPSCPIHHPSEMDILSIFHIGCWHNTYGSTLFFLSTSCIVWTENEIFFLIFWIITFTCSPSSTWPFIQSFNYSINQVMNFFVSISCWCQNIILFGIKNLSFFYHIFFF